VNSCTQTENAKGKTRVSGRVDWLLRFIVTLLVLAFPAATLYINRGDSYTLGLLVLIGTWVWVRDGARLWLNRQSAILCLSFALLFIVVLLSYVTGNQTEDGFHYLGRYLRFLFVVPAYLAFRRYPPTAKTVFIGLALGALTAGMLASLEFMRAHGPIRVEAQTDLSIIFGDLTTTMVLCTVAGFGLMAASRRNWSVPLLIACLAGGVAATLLSGTRGAWIPLLLLPLALMTPLNGFLKHRYIFAIILVLVAVFSSFYFVLRSGTQERLADVSRNISNYFIALHNLDGSTGNSTGAECVNNEKFMQAWLQSGRSFSGTPAVDIVHDAGIDHIAGCKADYAVRIHDESRQKAAQYILPRLPEPSGNEQQTTLLARGAGSLTFLGGQAASAIDSPAYTLVSLTDKETPAQAIQVFINISVAPGKTVWLVPLNDYFGEYSLSIANTSLGGRFEMWRAAWRLFLKHPWLGVGTGAFQANTLQLISLGIIAPFAGIYDHPHNDYLDALSSRGIIGFVVLLAVFMLPAWFFMKTMRSQEQVRHAIGLAGILTVSGFAIYALTDTIFLHSMMITWYVIYMTLFCALLDSQVVPQPESKSIK
jgi:O-antigen ligase